MEALNNNILLKKIEEKKVKGVIINSSQETDDTTTECEVVDAANKKLIDQEVLIKVNPKAWWCPNWLYKKIIKDHVSVMFFLTKTNL